MLADLDCLDKARNCKTSSKNPFVVGYGRQTDPAAAAMVVSFLAFLTFCPCMHSTLLRVQSVPCL